MKWTNIEKAKVKFDQQYLIASAKNSPIVGSLLKSETTTAGVRHTFVTSEGGVELSSVTHVAIITDPSDQ